MYCRSQGDKNQIFPSVCHFDQHMRPIVGTLALCLNDDSDAIFNDLIFYLGQIVGWSPSLFSHYRNPDTGIPWGTSTKEVTCHDKSTQLVELPNILKSANDGSGFQLISPTVVQVARNQFDCQTMTGVPFAGDVGCFGNWFDERLFYHEGLFTPLTLALLEDSGWYKIDYQRAVPALFGRGAGCGFVKGGCIAEEGDMPLYAKGFFGRGVGCDYKHSSKADVDEPAGDGEDMLCPLRSRTLVSCADESQSPTLPGETFGDDSRCYETNTGEPICLNTFCSQGKVHFQIEDEIKKCDFDGMTIQLNGYQLECPRAAVLCAREICPANCSGRGICDYCREIPECVCDDPFDVSEGCWGEASGAQQA